MGDGSQGVELAVTQEDAYTLNLFVATQGFSEVDSIVLGTDDDPSLLGSETSDGDFSGNFQIYGTCPGLYSVIRFRLRRG
jgi:hypothetical protein